MSLNWSQASTGCQQDHATKDIKLYIHISFKCSEACIYGPHLVNENCKCISSENSEFHLNLIKISLWLANC